MVVLCISSNAYSCCTTKSVHSEIDNNPSEVLQTTTEKEVQIVEEMTEMDVLETEVETQITHSDSANYNLDTALIITHTTWNDLLQKHVSKQGNVNYKGFKADIRKLNDYLEMLSLNPPQDSWSSNETLAYWMNVYNAFTVKLILDNYPVNSIKDINGPWNHRFIKIGEIWYTLNDVEHRIIRKMDEPRIHFALVCAAVSCPRLYNKAFTANHIEADLDLLTREFLNDATKNELSANSIKLSKIFKWYGGDFKKDGKDLIDFLNQYSDVQISSNAKKSYKDYNWNLNE